MRKYPLLPLALALMAGIAASRQMAPNPVVWLWLLGGGSLLTGAALLVGKKLRAIEVALTLLLSCSVGGLLGALEMQRDWTRGCSENTFLTVQLSETPMEGARSWRSRATVLSRGEEKTPCRGTITLYLRKDSTAATLHYGDRLLLHGYPDIERRNIYITSDHYLVSHSETKSLRHRSESLRLRLLHRMQTGPLKPPASGVAEALTLGWRGDITPATQSAFRDAGIAHLLAVSGLHVGLLAGIVGLLLFWTGNERRGRIVRGIVQLLAVWGFTLLSGMAPSTIRAALMFSLFIVAHITMRHTPTLNLLAAAAIVTLICRPSLLCDVGWLLSYSAVAGILLAQPVIKLSRNLLWRSATMSTAATLATLPVVISTFHRLPLYFLVANIVVVPLSGVLLASALLYMALPCVATAWPLEWLVRLFSWVTNGVASLPGAVVDNLHTTPWGLAAISTVILALLLCCRLPIFKPNRNTA